jgi:DivIVA domain-containing protein
MRCRECAAEVAVTAQVCPRCGAPIIGQPPVVAETVVADTVVPAVTRRPKEGHKGGKVAWVVMVCTAALLGIWLIIGSVALYVGNRDLAAHGVRTQGQVVETYADGSDEVVYTVGGTDYEVPGADVGDRLPGDAATVVYDPGDPANSNLEDDWVAWHLHWILLGVGLFVLGAPAIPVVTGIFEPDGRVGRRLARARPARRQLGTPPTPPGDTVVGAVSDAAGKGVPAGVAGQALPEPYVPGSGDSLPAELRLVLAGFIGIACGLFAGALACATAFGLIAVVADDLDRYNGLYDLLFGLVFTALAMGAFVGAWTGAEKGVDLLKARIRFSRLLRRPSDPHTATVTASKRGGRTLILDIIPRDDTGRAYQSLSEVRLALRTKADMLVPGETVKVYGGSGGKSELVISSPQRGRAFLGTVESQSALQPRLLDEKVSGVILLDWAAWAASMTFSSTGRRFGYDMGEVDAFRSAVRDTFLGVSELAVRSGDVRGQQFSTHKRGYDKTQVDAFVKAAGLRLAAMEATDRPPEPLVTGTILTDGPAGQTQQDFQPPRWAEWFEWAEWADSTRFSTITKGSGYDTAEVDAFRQEIRDTFLGVRQPPLTWDEARGKRFRMARRGYDVQQVDAFFDEAEQKLAAMRPTYRGRRA